SRMCPIDASTAYCLPRNFFSVRVLAGLSTISRFLATVLSNAARRLLISSVPVEHAGRDGTERGQYHRPGGPRKERHAASHDISAPACRRPRAFLFTRR